MTRIFIVHGWGGHPSSGWKPWLKKELEKQGCQVSVPAMPRPHHPIPKDWVKCLAETVRKPDADCFFVGHSLGCITILRYLETINKQVGGVITVAGFTSHLGYDGLENFFTKPIDWKKIKKNCRQFASIYSNNDETVSMHYANLFEQHVGAKKILDKGKGHFSGGEGITKVPSILRAMLQMIREK